MAMSLSIGILSFILLFLFSFLATVIITKWLVTVLPYWNMVDYPSSRRSHMKATPRGGGIGLLILFPLMLAIFEYLSLSSFAYSSVIIPIFVPIALVSLWDDVVGVHIIFRLFIHILSSVLAIMWMVHPNLIMYDHLPPFVDLAIGSFALLTFLNIFNFMDGIDGISASESMHLSITLLILCYLKADIISNSGFIVPSLLILLGFAGGFFLFNKSPARIFIGDVGSISLGFLYGLCLLMIASASAHLFLACVIASLYYVADGGLTLLTRMAAGEKIWQPHLKHFFQRAVKNGMSHGKVVSKIARCNFVLMLCAICCLYYPIISTIVAVIKVIYTLLRLTRLRLTRR